MRSLVLNNNVLFDMAQNDKVSTQYWAYVMTKSKNDRTFFDNQLKEFLDFRMTTQICVKAAVTVALGVSLFFAAAATLLYGASLILGLSNAIFSFINLNQYKIAVPEDVHSVHLDNFNAVEWETYRSKWCLDTQNHGFSAQQAITQTNMVGIGVALVVGFSAFAAVASGMAIPIALSSLLFSGTLFYQKIDDPTPYHEKESLPSLTMK